jgi:hypothetical protein
VHFCVSHSTFPGLIASYLREALAGFEFNRAWKDNPAEVLRKFWQRAHDKEKYRGYVRGLFGRNLGEDDEQIIADALNGETTVSEVWMVDIRIATHASPAPERLAGGHRRQGESAAYLHGRQGHEQVRLLRGRW